VLSRRADAAVFGDGFENFQLNQIQVILQT
jgi:hypothetical protein